ncbi:unnamed protein product [Rotaria sp. Silwood1]|nr:unnamed protein product [Rotaria sp. Silwood1]CAF1656348.1 unnamed protein product [Rotaria sp. Silwood1]CAF3646251.1 unnamed protein product [Rotaria sp. Silwood1]CAF3848216.1 unnamed protein product [Rotaria sp. Silwood1]CAF3873725.1 unnamed protein product [Rotaria sp. Silwood1]
MASNIAHNGWRVKIVSIPTSITDVQLAQNIGLPKSRIYIPKVGKNNTRYVWINDFVNEEDANKFAQQWSGSSIFGETIKCVVAPPRNDKTDVLYSSPESLVSGTETLPKKQHESRFQKGTKEKRDNCGSSVTPVPLMSVIHDITLDDAEKKSITPPPSYRFNKNQNTWQQHHKPDQLSQQAEKTLGKFLSINY